MYTELFPLLAATCFFVVLTAIMAACRFDIRNVIMLFALTVALYYGFRPILLVSGLDTPHPTEQFDLSDVGQLTGLTLVGLTAYLTAFAVSAVVALRLPPGRTSAFFVRSAPILGRLYAVTMLLTAVSVAITTVLVIYYEGLGEMIEAIKFDKELAGLYVLKIPSALGAVLAAATFLELRAQPDRRWSAALVLLGAMAVNSFCVFAWGQRSVLVVTLAILLLGVLGTQRRGGVLSPQRAIAAILVVVVVVIGTSAALRVARDTLSKGQVLAVYAEASPWRKASLAVNAHYFDATMLAFRDWPAYFHYRDGQDFITGTAGPVPRGLWVDKPESVRPGQWFRKVYEPERINGWPVGTPTVWYLNFGPLGLLIGGIVSGLLFGWLRRSQMNGVDCGLNFAIAVVAAIYVFELGWSSDTPQGIVTWIVPLWLIGWWVSRRRAGPTAATTSPPPVAVGRS